MTDEYTTTIERGDDGHEITVTVTYTKHKGCKGATDGRYGPKIEPDEPPSIEIDSVTNNETGEEMELTTREEDRILEAINRFEF
jgi:hypothetical protein